MRSVHQRDEDNIALVTLELSCVSAKKAMEFVTIRRDVFAEQTIDLKSLLVADQRDHAKRCWLARVILLVFGLLHRGGEQ